MKRTKEEVRKENIKFIVKCTWWALGILIFFNHFASWKLTVDPTPIEVEMRLYEDNVGKTLIQNYGRKERGIDVS